MLCVCVCVCVPRFLAKSLSLIAPPLVPQLRKNEDIDIMMQEAVVLASLKHPNIVSLVGVVTLGAPTLVVMEMLERGSLCKPNPLRFWAFVLCLCAVLVCFAHALPRARPKHPPPLVLSLSQISARPQWQACGRHHGAHSLLQRNLVGTGVPCGAGHHPPRRGHAQHSAVGQFCLQAGRFWACPSSLPQRHL